MTMKYRLWPLMAIAVMLCFLSGAPDVSAQTDRDKNEFYVGFEAMRNNVEVRLPNQSDFEYKPNQDKFGFRGEYTRKVHPNIGIGFRVGVTFENRDTSGEVIPCGAGCSVSTQGISKVALVHAEYLTRFQKATGKFRPFVEGFAGANRGNFGGITFASGVGSFTSKNNFHYGGGTGADFGGGKVALRIGVEYLNNGGLEGRQHNVILHVGPVWRFGKQ